MIEKPIRRRLIALALAASLGLVAASAAQEEGENAAAAPPDRVELRNGDRLSGRVVKMVGGVLELETAYAGTVAIDFAEVRAVESAGAVVELTGGERLEGALVAAPGDVLGVDRAGAAAPIAVAWADVAAINPPPQEADFRLALSVGANVQRGNSEQTSLAVGGRAEHATQGGRFLAALDWVSAEESGVRTARSTYGSLKYELLFDGPYFAYARTSFLSDEFKDLDLRSVAGVGLGYEAIASDRLSLSFEAGASFVSEDFIRATDRDELTIELGSDLEWALGEWATLVEDLSIRPSFDESSYQLRLESVLRSKLGLGWAFKLSNVLDIDSEPPPGVEERDLLWIAALEYLLD